MQIIKLTDLIPEIKGNKNIRQRNIARVIRAFQKVVTQMLLNKQEVKLTSFIKLGFRVAKDRMARSTVTKELLHIPQHLRFKATYYDDFKDFINKDENEKH